MESPKAGFIRHYLQSTTLNYSSCPRQFHLGLLLVSAILALVFMIAEYIIIPLLEAVKIDTSCTGIYKAQTAWR